VAGRETPATRAGRAAGIEHALHEHVHDPAADSYALEAAQALGLDPARVYKTLVRPTAPCAYAPAGGPAGRKP